MSRTWTNAQEAAMERYPCAVLVSAAAGSGKTSVLTERIIRSLTDEIHPQELSRLLIVTFTRAAAAELKSRIAKALAAAQSDSENPEQLTRQLLALGAAQISTIDSFFQKEVKENAALLGLPASFRMADAAELLPLKIELLNRLLEEFYRKNEKNGPVGTDGSAENPFFCAMEHLMENRSNGKTEESLLNFSNLFAKVPDGVETVKQSAEDLKSFAEKDYFESSYGEILRSRLLDFFKETEESLLSCKDSLISETDVFQRLCGVLNDDLNLCRRANDALEAKNYEQTKDCLASADFSRFPTLKNKTPNACFYQSFRDKFKKDLKKLTESFAFSQVEISRQMTETAAFLDVFYDFYKEYGQTLLEEKIKRGVLEFDDVRSLFHSLLKNEDGTPTVLAESLKNRFDAVYIDEYQDVDAMQDEIFRLIGQNCRFMVGDIKQSIYGFRGSEPSIFSGYRKIFARKKEEISQNGNGLCLFMSENFRCDKPIIETANCICSYLFSSCEKSIGYTRDDDLVCSKENGDGKTPVEAVIFEKSQKSDDGKDGKSPEANWVAAKISELLRTETKDDGTPFRPSDIAVLVRTNAQIPKFESALKALGIPVTSEAPNLASDPLLRDTLNFLTVIDNPFRDLPLSEFLLSPFADFSLSEITAIREVEPDSKALYDALTAYREIGENSALREKTNRLLEQIERLQSLAAVLPADRLLRILYAEPNLRLYCREPILTWIFDQAKTAQQNAFCGLSDFLKRLDNRIQTGSVNASGLISPEDAVSVLTIHRSKGLEYPAVFLTCLGAPFNHAESSNPVAFHPSVGYAVKLYQPKKGISTDTALRQAIKLRSSEEETEENIRTLYVALTRARERLFLTGTASGKIESLTDAASLLRPQKRQSLLSVGNYLPWILAPMMQTGKPEAFCRLRFVAPEEVSAGVPYRQDTALPSHTDNRDSDSPNAEFEAILEAEKSFRYSLFDYAELPGKVAASKLRPDLLDLLTDAEEKRGLEKQIELMASEKPAFDGLLSSGSAPTAAEIGTATHHFLEYCDFSSLAKNGLSAELSRLRADRYMSDGELHLLNESELQAFVKSNLMALLQSAAKKYRELEFGFFIPMKRLTKNPTLASALGERAIFVQGSLDLLVEEPDGSLVLVDYKTDRLTQEELTDEEKAAKMLFERHGEQLSVYCDAVKRLFGKAPDKVCIYSLPAGKGYFHTLQNP